MAVDRDSSYINEREIREAEIRLTGQLPSVPTAFIGFVPAKPTVTPSEAPATSPSQTAPSE